MTKEQAIAELTRAAELCPTTPLAEACRLVLTAGVKDYCYLCKHWKTPVRRVGTPCENCDGGLWEPKEVDNGQND